MLFVAGALMPPIVFFSQPLVTALQMHSAFLRRTVGTGRLSQNLWPVGQAFCILFKTTTGVQASTVAIAGALFALFNDPSNGELRERN